MPAKVHRACECCDECVYIGDGDFACMVGEEPEIVIEDWIPLRLPCEDYTEWERQPAPVA